MGVVVLTLVAIGGSALVVFGFLWYAGRYPHLTTDEFRSRLDAVPELLSRDAGPSEVAMRLGNSVKADESAVTAVYVALRFAGDAFEPLVQFCIAMGGDTDTIAAMAAGIWGASRGPEALPAAWLDKLEDRATIEANARALADAPVAVAE